MILSMTGFAAAAAELARAYRSRSSCARSTTATSTSSPASRRAARASSPRCARRSPARLQRGKVECRVALNRTPQAQHPAWPSTTRSVRQLAAAALEVRAARARRARRSRVTEVLRWPGVLAEPTVDRRARGARASRLVDEALRELTAARAPRRRQARPPLLERAAHGIEAQVARVDAARAGGSRRLQEKLAARLREAGLDPNEDRVEAGARAVRHQDRRGRGARAARRRT